MLCLKLFSFYYYKLISFPTSLQTNLITSVSLSLSHCSLNQFSNVQNFCATEEVEESLKFPHLPQLGELDKQQNVAKIGK